MHLSNCCVQDDNSDALSVGNNTAGVISMVQNFVLNAITFGARLVTKIFLWFCYECNLSIPSSTPLPHDPKLDQKVTELKPQQTPPPHDHQ